MGQHRLPFNNHAFAQVMLLVATGVIFADLVESMALPNSQDYVRAAFEKDAQLVYVPKQVSDYVFVFIHAFVRLFSMVDRPM